ncbi:MAG: hypothetical protein C0394_02120 [Syntrophus sp. (in: bacteria)]|nr:hypothetical protein [Syntrophus sp. (in: bacteria)]
MLEIIQADIQIIPELLIECIVFFRSIECQNSDGIIAFQQNLAHRHRATPNRHAPDSFVGRSYAFRRYYRTAAGGAPADQFAIGVTSGERGYCAGHPVRDPDGLILGVAVVKLSLDRKERDYFGAGNIFFVNPEGIVFLSGRPETRLMALWPLGAATAARLAAGKDFGPGPFPALLSREPSPDEKIVFKGRAFVVSRRSLNPEGWSLLRLNPAEQIAFCRFFGIAITFFGCMLIIGMSLYLKNNIEFTTRLALSENRFRTIFENAPGAIILVDEKTERIVHHNPFLEKWLGYRKEELSAMTLEGILVPDGEEKGVLYRKKDGTLVDVEETRTQIAYEGSEAFLIVANDISEHKRTAAILHDLSHRNGLTGIANRRYFDEVLEREWRRALREQTPLAVILCDIDFFKSFNDANGHQQGDECLRAKEEGRNRVAAAEIGNGM